MTAFEHVCIAGWAHMDANGHMRNTAFIDLAVDTRLLYLASAGFDATDMVRHAIGPVVRRDDIEYYKEVRLLDRLCITFTVGGLSDDGSRFIMVNDVYRADGRLMARLRTHGGWLDLNARALTAPPPVLLAAMRALDRTESYETLDSSLKGK